MLNNGGIIMAWLARDLDNDLYVYTDKPKRDKMRSIWVSNSSKFAKLSDSADKLLIDKTITWNDEPIELK